MLPDVFWLYINGANRMYHTFDFLSFCVIIEFLVVVVCVRRQMHRKGMEAQNIFQTAFLGAGTF